MQYEILKVCIHVIKGSSRIGREGVKEHCKLFLNVVFYQLWCIVILRRGLKINIFKVIFWWGKSESQKRVLYVHSS